MERVLKTPRRNLVNTDDSSASLLAIITSVGVLFGVWEALFFTQEVLGRTIIFKRGQGDLMA